MGDPQRDGAFPPGLFEGDQSALPREIPVAESPDGTLAYIAFFEQDYQLVTDWHVLDPQTALERLKVNPHQGLAADVVQLRRKKYGLNELKEIGGMKPVIETGSIVTGNSSGEPSILAVLPLRFGGPLVIGVKKT